MGCKVNTPWHRYALIAELALRFEGKSTQFGKTSLQKMVYLLQELGDVSTNYHFSLYTHGPFTAQLLGDLDLVEALGAVKVQYVLSEYGGYQISPCSEWKAIRDKGAQFLDDNRDAIDRLVNGFGRFSAKELELRSTIVYLDREIKRSKKSLDRGGFIGLVKKIKPQF
ncbi:MAG: YwgA family protein, partial [Desulfomonilaceae bacterium]